MHDQTNKENNICINAPDSVLDALVQEERYIRISTFHYNYLQKPNYSSATALLALVYL
jgi:hypothetical protein